MIEVFKLIKPKYDEVVAQDFLNYVSAEDEQYNFRDHSDVMLKGERYSKDVKNFSFKSRTVNQWNSLPKEVRTAPSLNAFKQRIDSFIQPLCSTLNANFKK